MIKAMGDIAVGLIFFGCIGGLVHVVTRFEWIGPLLGLAILVTIIFVLARLMGIIIRKVLELLL